MSRWLRWLLFLAVLGLVGRWLLAPAAGHTPTASIDASVFADAEKDAQPVSRVLDVRGSEATHRPNIVLILADDLGYGDLASFGSRAIRTPNLDRLAAEGVRFDEFYASAPICSPSRAGLLTGRYPIRTGISYIIFASEISLAQRLNLAVVRLTTGLGLADFHDSFVSGMPDSEITLPEALKVAGYATGMVGKWHLGDFSHNPAYLPTRHGFDFFEGLPHSNDEFPAAYYRNEEEITPNIGLDQEHITGDLTRAAIGFIEKNRERPFFLYFAHKDVHLPFYPSQRFKGQSPGGLYGDAAEELDDSVEQVLTALERNGLRENTVVLFTSDNGPWYEGSTQGLRGRKGMSFEGGFRVPLIVSWPGRLPAGAQLKAPSMNIDLFPTLLALAGVSVPNDRVIDGRDLGDLLFGRSRKNPHQALYFFHDKDIDAVRSDRWKYYRQANRYRWPVPLDKPSTLAGKRVASYVYEDERTGRSAHLLPAFPLLYDMALDPGESYDVLDRHAPQAALMKARIEHMERELAANPRGWTGATAQPLPD